VEDWLKSKNIDERNTMIKWALYARIIITCTYLIIIISFIIVFVMPVFGKSIRMASNISDSSTSLIIPAYYIYDVTKRPEYELTIVGQYITIIITAILYTGVDDFLGFLVFHICGQLDIMMNRFKYSQQDFHSMLRNNVIYHIRLLKYAYIVYIYYMSLYVIQIE